MIMFNVGFRNNVVIINNCEYFLIYHFETLMFYCSCRNGYYLNFLKKQNLLMLKTFFYIYTLC